MSNKLSSLLNDLEKNKGMNKNSIIETLKESLTVVCKKNYKKPPNLDIKIDENNNKVKIFIEKEVVEKPSSKEEISLEDAKIIKNDSEIGDKIKTEISLDDFGRIGVKVAKQVVIQKLHDKEQNLLLEKFKNYINNNVNGIVRNVDQKNILIEIDGNKTLLPPDEQMFNDRYEVGKNYKFYVSEIVPTKNSLNFVISRTKVEFIIKLFEEEIPEIKEGIIKIKSLAREAGIKTKISVYSTDSNIDPLGACLGLNAERIKNITKELRGENVEVVLYSENIKEYLKNCLKPAEINDVIINENTKYAKVMVAKDQLSLAIGAKGLNVKLTSKLTRYKIEIIESQNDNSNTEI